MTDRDAARIAALERAIDDVCVELREHFGIAIARDQVVEPPPAAPAPAAIPEPAPGALPYDETPPIDVELDASAVEEFELLVDTTTVPAAPTESPGSTTPETSSDPESRRDTADEPTSSPSTGMPVAPAGGADGGAFSCAESARERALAPGVRCTVRLGLAPLSAGAGFRCGVIVGVDELHDLVSVQLPGELEPLTVPVAWVEA